MAMQYEPGYAGLGARASLRDLVPSPSHAAAIWARNAKVFSKLWKGVLLPQFIDPLFYLVALGFGLGTYVARINGVPYEDFIAPGLISSWWAILIPVFVLLGGLCFSVVGYTFTSLIPKIDLYSYFFTLFITPMFLFSGIFFNFERPP